MKTKIDKVVQSLTDAIEELRTINTGPEDTEAEEAEEEGEEKGDFVREERTDIKEERPNRLGAPLRPGQGPWFAPKRATELHRERGNYVGGKPKFIVLHFTAGQFRTNANMIATMRYGQNQGLTFAGVARDGTRHLWHNIDKFGWHAGASNWRGVSSLNNKSFGIEMANPGRLERKNGRWQTWYGEDVTGHPSLITVASKENVVRGTYIKASPEQVISTLELTMACMCYWGLAAADVTSHDEISPGRKSDMGAIFGGKTISEIRKFIDDNYPFFIQNGGYIGPKGREILTAWVS